MSDNVCDVKLKNADIWTNSDNLRRVEPLLLIHEAKVNFQSHQYYSCLACMAGALYLGYMYVIDEFCAVLTSSSMKPKLIFNLANTTASILYVCRITEFDIISSWFGCAFNLCSSRVEI
jgi:hypothetical protein